MEYPKFFYRYVAQSLRYKRDEFSSCIFPKIKIIPKYPKVQIVTDGYQNLFICLSPLTVAFQSKNDFIIEIMHLFKCNIDFLKILELWNFWLKT